VPLDEQTMQSMSIEELRAAIYEQPEARETDPAMIELYLSCEEIRRSVENGTSSLLSEEEFFKRFMRKQRAAA
jgi:hypothetical protein